MEIVAKGTIRSFGDVVVEADSAFVEFVARLRNGAILFEGESLPEALRVATEATPSRSLTAEDPEDSTVYWMVFAAEFRAKGYNVSDLNEEARTSIEEAEAMYS